MEVSWWTYLYLEPSPAVLWDAPENQPRTHLKRPALLVGFDPNKNVEHLRNLKKGCTGLAGPGA